MIRTNGTLLGDFDWEEATYGGLGWVTSGFATYDQSIVFVGCDATQAYYRATEGPKWLPVFTEASLPAEVKYDNGGVQGNYATAPAGQSNDRFYTLYRDRILRTNNRFQTWTSGSLTGLAVPCDSNTGGQRVLGPKMITDPANIDFCIACPASNGTFRTLNGWQTHTKLSWLPDPSLPNAGASAEYLLQERYTTLALDLSSSTSARRIAFSPCGQGIWLSSNGGTSGTQIAGTGVSGAGAVLTSVTQLAFGPDGTLWAVRGNDTGWGALGKSLWSWTQAGGWVNYTSMQSDLMFICKDPTSAGAWFGVCDSNVWVRTTDNFATFQFWAGGGSYFVDPINFTFDLRQVKVTSRPLMAQEYRQGIGSFAPSVPFVAGEWLFGIAGLGVMKIKVADFPTTAPAFNAKHYNAGWPNWIEDVAGIEELVGQSCLWRGDRLICHGQDRPILLWPERSMGERVSNVHNRIGITNGTGSGIGENGFCASNAAKGGSAVAYSRDGRKWTQCVNQPLNANAGTNNGPAIVGVENSIFIFPSAYLVRGDTDPYPILGRAGPQYTMDAGATAWQPCVFKRQNGTTIDFSNASFGGFGGIIYPGNNRMHAVRDPSTGFLYAVNIGATTNADFSYFVQDDLDAAGLYRHRPGVDPDGTFIRIKTGNPTPYGNYGFYDCKLAADGNGHLVWMSNPLAMTETGNVPRLYDLAANTWTDITGFFNVQSLDFGAPLPGKTQPALWLYGYKSGGEVRGIYVLPSLLTDAPQGPFNHKQPGGGAITYIAAHKTRPAVLGAGIVARGHAIGRLRRKVA